MKSKSDKPIKISLFHMENCVHCDQFMPEWKNLTSIPQKNIAFNDYERMQMEDLSESERTINGEEINGFPTIKIKVFDKEYYYNKERSKQAILAFIRDRLKNRVNGVETEVSDSPQMGGQDDTEQDTEQDSDISTSNVTPDVTEERRSPSETEERRSPSETKSEERRSPSETEQKSFSIFAKESKPEPDTTGGGIIRSEFDRLLMKEINALSDFPF